MCQTWSLSVWTRALGRQQVERRELQVGERLDRPAVVAVGGDVRARPCLARSRIALEQRRRRRRRAPPPAPAPRRPRRSAAGRGRADRRVLLPQQLLRLGRPRHQLAVEADPVGLELVPEAGRVERRRARGRGAARSSAGVVEEPPAGARVDDADLASSTTPKRVRAASSSRQTTTTAREPMCFSSQTTVGDALAAVVGERLGRVFQQARSRWLVSHGDIVGGR